jgi:transposase-like protein
MTYLPQRSLELKTLQDAFAYFSDRQRCVDYVVAMRWPDGKVSCPTCGSEAVTWLPTRFLFQCKGKHAKRQFSVKVGTLMEDSPIPLGQWLLISWMLGSCRNGISSYEVARTIGITQKSAWFMLHRLREGMQDDSWKLSGTVEADETYVGGRIKNKHEKARKQGYAKDKIAVIGVVERGGRVAARVVPSIKKENIHALIEGNVEKSAIVYTDDFPIYDKLASLGFTHEVINHTQDRFARGPMNTNSIENFWSCLKRTIKGTYVAVSPAHLNSYVIEQAFRFNVRKGFSEQQRGIVLLNGIQGKRLTYKSLIARTAL